ncbi:hypothetical protein RESH_02637 [Rhodopirellula europaea SH398]|uniref:Uncharacterized protein n=1 Tax=Rhodopirellula europaea SH398 TaxID=1263868 RepID=M5SKK1_9BACT|nr:hypothetical protein RESH_02637 [Rhodopirellula europaea SH398]
MPQTGSQNAAILATLPVARDFPAVSANRFLHGENRSICRFAER